MPDNSSPINMNNIIAGVLVLILGGSAGYGGSVTSRFFGPTEQVEVPDTAHLEQQLTILEVKVDMLMEMESRRWSGISTLTP